MIKKRGFTLIEIMVVIVIMGILAAVAVPKLFGSVAKAKASEIAPAAGTYQKLQDLHIAEKGAVGNWNSIGYVAPGSGSTNNFTYCGGEIETDIEVDKFGDAAKVGWQATNKTSLNDCSAGHWWFVSLKPESSSNVIYTNETNASECVALATPKWDVSNRTGVACGVAGNTEPKEVNMLENTVVAIKGTWDGSGGHGQNSSNYRLSTKNTSDGSDGLFKLEPNSTYTFTISAGEDLAEGELNVGILLYEDSTGKSRAVVDDGWYTKDKAESAGRYSTVEKVTDSETGEILKKANGQDSTKSVGHNSEKYTTAVSIDKATNTYTVTIKTSDDVSYFGSNLRVSSNTDFTDSQREAITKAIANASLVKQEEEQSAGSSSSKK